MQLQANIVFVASKEVVLFTSRSPSNIVNGIAFQKLQNFVSLLYVILINFEKCNKRTDNFLKKRVLVHYHFCTYSVQQSFQFLMITYGSTSVYFYDYCSNVTIKATFNTIFFL